MADLAHQASRTQDLLAQHRIVVLLGHPDLKAFEVDVLDATCAVTWRNKLIVFF